MRPDYSTPGTDELRSSRRSHHDFMVDQFHLDPISVHKAIQAVADSWRRPSGTVNDVLDRLNRAGLPQTAAVLRRWHPGLTPVA